MEYSLAMINRCATTSEPRKVSEMQKCEKAYTMNKFQLTKHRAMWKFIARQAKAGTFKNGMNMEIAKAKAYWIDRNEESGEIPFGNCYACEYARNNAPDGIMRCEQCPFEVPPCLGDYSPWLTLIKEGNKRQFVRAAEAIRDAKVKDGVEWE